MNPIISKKLVFLITAVLLLTLPVRDGFLAAQQENPATNETDLIKQYKTNKFLDRIKLEISSSEDELFSVNREISETQGKIQESLDKISTLKGQLDNLDKQIAATQNIINNVEAQIARKESEIETLEYQIEQKKIEISYQRQLISGYLEVIFKDQHDFSTLDSEGAYLNTLKLLLSDDSTSEKLRSIRYSEVLEEQGREIFERLGDLMQEQEADQKIMEVKKYDLIIYHQKISAEKADLELMKQAKQTLLEQTKGEEDIYQQLLARSKAQQEDVLLEIDTLRKNLAYVQNRIKELGSGFDPDDYATLLNAGTNKKLLDYLTFGLSQGEFSPIWPITPARGISAYFHEASYARFFGMRHDAIDIRANQETPVRAAADGIVYRAADNGYGYSYIIVAHLGGYMTLYGHISKMLVDEGDEVRQGDLIGLSGGIPGTRGAGVYTTGPHLHFEIIKDGDNEDPMNYLNLAFLNFAELPEKYVSKALGDRSKVRRVPVKTKVRNPYNELALRDISTGGLLSD